MQEYTFNNLKYIVEKDENDIFDYTQMQEMITPYFNDYDYILGDIAYNKIRLKGFCDKKNKNLKEINNIKNLDKYLNDYCAYGCKWFLLKKMQ